MGIREFQKALRFNQTEAESRLWFYLRAKRFGDFKFKRQQIIGPYIVDFVCFKKRLVIELDGGQHQEKEIRGYDVHRTKFLESQGFRVLRFWNNDVFLETAGVLESIFLNLSRKAKEPPL